MTREQKISKQNKENCRKKKALHTAGTKSEDVVAGRLQLENIENHVQNHDVELLELKAKTNKLEKEQMNQVRI